MSHSQTSKRKGNKVFKNIETSCTKKDVPLTSHVWPFCLNAIYNQANGMPPINMAGGFSNFPL